MGLFPIRAPLKISTGDLLPDATGSGRNHGCGLLAAEAFGEFWQILEDSVGAVLVRGVGIGLGLGAQLLGAGLGAPLLGVGDPEALVGRVSIGGGFHVDVCSLGPVKP